MNNTKTSDNFHYICFHKKTRVRFFLSLTMLEQSEMLRFLSKKILKDILTKLPQKNLIQLMEYVDPDEATRLLRFFHPKKRKEILNKIHEDIQTYIERLLEFDPSSAAGLMSLDYIQSDHKDTFAEVVTKFKYHEKKTGRPPIIMVLKQGKLCGYLPGYQLGMGKRNEKILKYVKKIISIQNTASHQQLIDKFLNHPHDKLVVVGERDEILGVVYSDDILYLLKKNESSSLYDFAGIDEEESISDPVLVKFKFRHTWLMINLLTAFFAASVVGLFEDTISKYVLLAVYMPIVAGMGGNAATQTLAVMVRGISLKQISLKNCLHTLKNELLNGLFNGIINGILVAGIILFINRDWKIAVLLGTAMACNLLVAAFFGTLIPLIMKRLGKDPASSASIFITTATDVLGFLIFLGTATIFLD